MNKFIPLPQFWAKFTCQGQKTLKDVIGTFDKIGMWWMGSPAPLLPEIYIVIGCLLGHTVFSDAAFDWQDGHALVKNPSSMLI